MAYMDGGAVFADGIQELTFDEIEEVNGGRVNWRMVEEGGLLIGHVRQRGVISAVALGHRQAAFAVMCSG
ncbi:hypothetical protein [Novosphingobium sp.]|uniref:hypothetical protein n=1 Tax=Novosphingobium sp. TaxID=1874826 RepID=UPI0035B49403